MLFFLLFFCFFLRFRYCKKCGTFVRSISSSSQTIFTLERTVHYTQILYSLRSIGKRKYTYKGDVCNIPMGQSTVALNQQSFVSDESK